MNDGLNAGHGPISEGQGEGSDEATASFTKSCV